MKAECPRAPGLWCLGEVEEPKHQTITLPKEHERMTRALCVVCLPPKPCLSSGGKKTNILPHPLALMDNNMFLEFTEKLLTLTCFLLLKKTLGTFSSLIHSFFHSNINFSFSFYSQAVERCFAAISWAHTRTVFLY